ncbi:MAG: T9SS type A sorting domain-containing protein [Ignavibacteria bacterium]|nr:T9SS type A sorting domain-containing protein [Ignavibacteria bacterium]
MKKTWLTFIVGACTLLLTAGFADSARAAGDDAGKVLSGIGSVTVATNPVTFQVDMRVRICEGLMTVGDEVSVPGDHNGWTPGATVATDPDGDSIYVAIADIGVGTISYKFHDGNDWENDPNRTFTVNPDSIANIIPVVYFNDDDVCDIGGADVPVVFQVDMSVKMIEGSFAPSLGEWVGARGSFNSWSPGDTLTDGDGDSVYTGTMMLAEGSDIEYKFVIRNDDGSDTWEDNIPGNRAYTVPTGGGTIPVVYFDDDDVVSIPVTQNILMKTDLNTFFGMGWFDPSAGDQIEARGAFNSWVGGDVCQDPLGLNEYEWLESGFSAFSGDSYFYKFFIKFDSLSAITRFPTYADDVDGHSYEHPAERGDGNRVFIHPAMDGDVGPDTYWFSSIHPSGVINPTDGSGGDVVEVTITADMTPAITLGFDPAVDTAQVELWDDLWVAVQVREQGSFPAIMNMTRVGMTNNFTATFDVVGTTHYNLMYHLRFSQPGGTILGEGGGLGVQNPYRSRYIQPLGPNSFPTTYSTPVDTWDLDGAPLVAEVAPFSILTSVEPDPVSGQPVLYRLNQNYPNPFNPSTRIKYQIPERSKVTLKVYNLIGQHVSTLIDNVQEAGSYVALFEANDLASGVYFYELQAGDFRQTMKMLFMK